MAHFIIETTKEEQDKVISVIKTMEGETVAVKDIARKADLSPSRTRYVIVDLVEANKIRRIPTKAFNKNYVRYKYEVV